MTSAVDKDSSRRVRDAAASRRGLLAAGGELFHARGYEGATVRDIGERAGVDPALIARYFGSKEGLYLAALSRDPGDGPAPGGDPHEFVQRLLSRHEARGIGPVALAMVSPTLSDAAREQVREILAARAIGPIAAALRQRGVAEPELRAELVAGLAVGLSLVRLSGTLPTLAEASTDELLAALAPAIGAL